MRLVLAGTGAQGKQPSLQDNESIINEYTLQPFKSGP